MYIVGFIINKVRVNRYMRPQGENKKKSVCSKSIFCEILCFGIRTLLHSLPFLLYLGYNWSLYDATKKRVILEILPRNATLNFF